MKKTIPIFLFALFLIACGKTYDDGPKITFRSAKNRITGTWKVDKFYIEGIDSTDEFNAKLGCELEFTKEIYSSSLVWKLYLKNCINNEIYYGFWYFHGNHNERSKVAITFIEDPSLPNAIGPIGQNRNGVWIILKLTNKEFNLTTENRQTNWSLGERTFILKLKKK